MRKLSNLLILITVAVWSYQFSLWVATGNWEGVAARGLLSWLGWMPATGSLLAALCDLNIGLLTLITGLGLFYASYPAHRLLDERRDTLERLSLHTAIKATRHDSSSPDRTCGNGGSHFWHVS